MKLIRSAEAEAEFFGLKLIWYKWLLACVDDGEKVSEKFHWNLTPYECAVNEDYLAELRAAETLYRVDFFDSGNWKKRQLFSLPLK